MRSLRYIALALIALTLVSCNRDPNYLKQQYLSSGNKYFDKTKYKEASIMYRKAIEQDRKWGPGYYRLALTFLKQGTPASAVPAFRRAVELLPKGSTDYNDATLKLAEILVVASQAIEKNEAILKEVEGYRDDLLKRNADSWEGHKLAGDMDMIAAGKMIQQRNSIEAKKELGNAIVEYRKALSKKTVDPTIALALARTLMLDGEVAESESILKGLIQKDKKNLAAYAELYRIYGSQRKFPEAEAILKAAIAADPKNADLRLSLAQFYFGTNRRDDLVKLIAEMKRDTKTFPKAYVFAGDFYLRVGQLDDAVKQYEEGVKSDPSNKIDYLKHEVEVYVRAGKADLAFQKNEEILKADSKDPEARGLKATFMLDKGDVDAAAAELQSVVTAKPTNFVARFNLGRAHFAKGEYEQARQEFDKAIELQSDYLPARLAATQVALVREDYELALKSADAILKMFPNSPQGQVMKAAALQRVKKFAEARQLLQGVLDKQPKQTETLLEMGVLDLNEKKFAEASEMFKHAWDTNNSNVRGLLGYAEATLQLGDRDKAVEIVQTEAKKNPSRVDLQRELGNIQMRAGKLDDAVVTYNALFATIKDPKQQSDLNTRIGETYARKGDLQKSIDSLEKARTLDPANAALPTNIAMLYEMENKVPDARKYYDLAVKADPNNPIALNNLAYLITETNGDLDLALTYAQRAKQKLPNFSEISDTLGWIYLKKNLTDNAMDTFKNLTAQVPTNSTYHFHYAMALAQKGQREQSAKECLAALAQKPKKVEEDKIRELMKKVS